MRVCVSVCVNEMDRTGGMVIGTALGRILMVTRGVVEGLRTKHKGKREGRRVRAPRWGLLVSPEVVRPVWANPRQGEL